MPTSRCEACGAPLDPGVTAICKECRRASIEKEKREKGKGDSMRGRRRRIRQARAH